MEWRWLQRINSRRTKWGTWSVEPKGLLIVSVPGLNFGWPWWLLSYDFVHILWQHFIAVLVLVSLSSTSHVGLVKSALGFYFGSAGFKCGPRHRFFTLLLYFIGLCRELLKRYVDQTTLVFSSKSFQMIIYQLFSHLTLCIQCAI
jgi:hypothetical protein